MVELEFVPRDGGASLTIGDEAITSLNATLTNTGVGTFRATIKGDRRLEDRAAVQNRVNVVTDDTKFAGYITNCAQGRADGSTQIQGKGIAKKLQESRPDYQANGGPIVYDKVFAGDAIEDYWSRTPFGNVTVTKQQSNVVVQDSLTQSADTASEWNDILADIANDEPLDTSNGKLQLLQTAFVAEGEASSGDTNSDVAYSGGSAAEIAGSGSDDIVLSFSNGYTIPDFAGEFWVRAEAEDAAGNQATYDVSFDGTTVFNDVALVTDTTLGWEKLFDTSNVAIDSDTFAGNHTVTIEFSTAFDNVATYFDVLAFVDGRFQLGPFDNTVNTDNGYLDTPALFAANQTIKTTTTPVSRNIVEANVTTTFDNTNNNQRLGVSQDGGANFTRASNTNSLTANFADAGRELVTEFRLSGYDNGARNATPRFNYLGQEVDSFETTVDLDNRVVFIGVEASKNHFENLQKIHENSEYVWTIEHDDSSVTTMPVFSFPRGEETRPSSLINDNEIDESPEVSGEQFYNKIPLQGGLDEDGNRPFAEVEDSTSISNVGEAISPGLLRDPTISSEIEAEFIAQALLKKALKNGELRGQKTIPPTFTPTPGFAYPVSWLNDSTVERTLEEVSVTKSTGSAQTVLDFTGRTGFAQEIDELRRQARETQDEV